MFRFELGAGWIISFEWKLFPDDHFSLLNTFPKTTRKFSPICHYWCPFVLIFPYRERFFWYGNSNLFLCQLNVSLEVRYLLARSNGRREGYSCQGRVSLQVIGFTARDEFQGKTISTREEYPYLERVSLQEVGFPAREGVPCKGWVSLLEKGSFQGKEWFPAKEGKGRSVMFPCKWNDNFRHNARITKLGNSSPKCSKL